MIDRDRASQQRNLGVNYKNLLYMALLSFLVMYILMYLMVNTYANVYANLNQLYMAGIMTTPMILIELILMRSMYANQRLNHIIIALCLAVFSSLCFLLRNQIAITDAEFIRAMIPHHAGALLMCEKAQLQDRELIELCQRIKLSQQAEINFMQAKLTTLSANDHRSVI